MDEEERSQTIRHGVTVSEFRRRLAHYVALVRYGDDWVCIHRKGMEPVYLVSEADMKLIWDTSDEFYGGGRDADGFLKGRGLWHWICEGFRRDRAGR